MLRGTREGGRESLTVIEGVKSRKRYLSKNWGQAGLGSGPTEDCRLYSSEVERL